VGATEVSGVRQYLSFSLGGIECALSIVTVREILQYEAITRIPSVPPSIRGVINRRGSVVPVIDLARKFGLPEAPVTRLSCILIVEAQLGGEPVTMGLLVDSVSEVVDLAPGDVEPPPAFGARVRIDFLVGMGKVAKGFLLILDLDRILSADELVAAAAVEQAAGAVPAER
jgi:purine-binding chemotaxis protein CheW